MATNSSSTISGSDEDAAEVSQNLPPTPQKEGEKEGEDGELKKQEMLVQYLKDTETFALQVERAISVINSMLYWKSTSGSGTVISRVSLSTKGCSVFSGVFTFSVNFVPSGPGGRAVLCDGVRVWRRQLRQRGEEDAAAGVVDRRCH